MADIRYSRAIDKTLKSNRVNIYNIVPPDYLSFEAMREDLHRIQDMGFNAVWLNPFLEVGKQFYQRPIEGEDGMHWVKDCLYAATYDGYKVTENGQQHYYILNLQNPMDRFSTKEISDAIAANERTIEQIQAFTRDAYSLGLTPMFDLVLNHIAIDSPLYRQKAWFLQDQPHPIFDDVIGFMYEDHANSEINQRIFDEFWKDKIDFYIDTLCFRGVRVDCVSYTNRYIMEIALRYIRNKLQTKYGIENPIIFGELIGKKETQPTFPQMQALGAMKMEGHLIPFSHLMLGTNELIPISYADIGTDVNVNDESLLKLDLIDASPISGLLGAAGTHDRLPLYPSCKKLFKETHDRFVGDEHAELLRMMKEKILMTVISSNAGWYLMSGDEFGDKLIKQPPFLYRGEMVVKVCQEDEVVKDSKVIPQSMKYRYEGRTIPSELHKHTKIDLQGFIKIVNKMALDIKYPDDEKPLCCFYKHPNHIFITVGNFNYHGRNYIAIDLNGTRLDFNEFLLNESDIAIYQRRFDSYKEVFYSHIRSEAQTLLQVATVRAPKDLPGISSFSIAEMSDEQSAYEEQLLEKIMELSKKTAEVEELLRIMLRPTFGVPDARLMENCAKIAKEAMKIEQEMMGYRRQRPDIVAAAPAPAPSLGSRRNALQQIQEGGALIFSRISTEDADLVRTRQQSASLEVLERRTDAPELARNLVQGATK